MVEDGAFIHKIDNVTIFKEILNCKEHSNCITGSKVTAILLNGLILPISGATTVKGLPFPACAAGLFLDNVHPNNKSAQSPYFQKKMSK